MAVRVEATAVLAVRAAAATCVVLRLPRRGAEAMPVVLAPRCVVRQQLVRLLHFEEALLALR